MSVKFLLRRAAAVAPYCVLLLLPRFACGQTRRPVVDARATQVLEAADDAQEAIERVQSRIDRSLAEYFRQLDGAIELVNDEDFFGEQMTFATLRAITPRLRQMARDAIAASTANHMSKPSSRHGSCKVPLEHLGSPSRYRRHFWSAGP